MIEVIVKTIYNGCAPVRDYYMQDALNEHKFLKITLDKDTNQFMVVHPVRYAYKSKTPFKARFNDRGDYHIIYYKWRPGYIDQGAQPTTKSLFQ